MAKKTEPVAPAQATPQAAPAQDTPPAAPAEGAPITEGAPDASTDAKDADQDANVELAAPAADPAPVAPAATPAAPAPTEAPKVEEVKKPAAGAKVVFTEDAAEAEVYVKQGYLVRLMRHEGVMGYKVFLTQKVHALGQGDSPVSKA